MRSSLKTLTKYLWDVLAVFLIIVGLLALLTPLTPGSWLAVIGLSILIGKRKTQSLFLKTLGKKWFAKLGIKKIFKRY